MNDKKFSTIHVSEDAYYDYCLQELKDKKMWGQADYIESLRTQLAEATRKLEEARKVQGQLVNALNLALEYWRHRQQRYKNRHPVWVEAANEAIYHAIEQGKERG